MRAIIPHEWRRKKGKMGKGVHRDAVARNTRNISKEQV